jgi:glycosyltransferase involved in cell wall biosynthesis
MVAKLLRGDAKGLVEAKCLGVLDAVAKARALAEADVLALPSYSEALPYAILEGAAAGLPIIATEVGMVPELRERGLQGEFVGPGEVGRLADAIVALADPARRAVIGHANQAFVAREFDTSLLPRRLTELYQRVMAGDAFVRSTDS